MSKFIAEFEFGTNANQQEAQDWFNLIMDAMPEDAVGTLRQQPLVLDLLEVQQEHAGNIVKFYSPTLRSDVRGVLEHVFVGKNDDSRILVVDGKAYELTYAAVQLAEW